MFRYADPLACPRCRSALPTHASLCEECATRLDTPQAHDVFRALTQVDALVAQLPHTAAAAMPAPPAETMPAPPVAAMPVPPAAAMPAPPAVPLLTAAAVPRILLGLGALCLLVAALVFLIVAWAALGVGGRTAVLAGFTLLTGGLAAWSARAGLRAGAEAFAAVALGLLALDLSGARTSGWFGQIGDGGFGILLGTVLASTAVAGALAARRTREPRLWSTEVAAGLGVLSVDWGIGQLGGGSTATWALVVLLVTAAAAVLLLRARLLLAATLVGAQAAVAWAVLALDGLGRAITEPSLAALWGELEVWPLLAATGFAAGLAAAPSLAREGRVAAATVASMLATVVVAAPAMDESARVVALVGIAFVAVHAALAEALRRQSWAPAAIAPMVLAATGLALTATAVGGAALLPLVDHGVWDLDAASTLDTPPLDRVWALLLPAMVAAVLGAGLVLGRAAFGDVRRALPAAGAVLLLSAAVAPTLLGITVTAAVAVLLAATAVLAATAARLRDPACAVSAVIAWALALAAGLADDGSTVTVLALGTAAAITLDARGPRQLVAAARVTEAVLGGALIWSALAMAGVPVEWRALPILVTLGIVCVVRPRPTTEAPSAAVAGIAVLLACVDADPANGATGLDSSLLALHLTVAGVIVTLETLLHPHRRRAGWIALALFTLAQWLRLQDLGVATVEAYTLPLALVLLAVGLWTMRTTERSSMRALPTGLGLALVPTLLQVLVEPTSVRALLLGLACVALVGAGVRLRWSAPLLAGASTGALVVLRQATEAHLLPQWVVIGIVGAVLTFVGLTWERRLADLRRAGSYLRALR